MSNTELIKELRALTQAGMKDCKDALEESSWDLQKAVDIVKVKGLNIVSGREGRVASEGRVTLGPSGNGIAMVEINCQTDFVADSKDFKSFCTKTLAVLSSNVEGFSTGLVEDARKEVVASTKENVVVRRWWLEESLHPTTGVFSYLHSNNKIGVLVTLQAPSEAVVNSSEFHALGNELAMQIAAMNPLAVSADRIPTEEKTRQESIFITQLKEDVKPKPEAMWPKIIEGKFRKWNTEVCLLEQESVVVAKTSVRQVIKNVGDKLGGEITVVNFVRCQVGEGIEVKKDNLAEEVSKLTGVEQPHTGYNPLTQCDPNCKK
jgi:elongation factor Ts